MAKIVGIRNLFGHHNIPSYSSRFRDPGPHGSGRYSEHMLPEVEKKDFHKGAQVYFISDICIIFKV